MSFLRKGFIFDKQKTVCFWFVLESKNLWWDLQLCSCPLWHHLIWVVKVISKKVLVTHARLLRESFSFKLSVHSCHLAWAADFSNFLRRFSVAVIVGTFLLFSNNNITKSTCYEMCVWTREVYEIYEMIKTRNVYPGTYPYLEWHIITFSAPYYFNMRPKLFGVRCI